MTSLYPVLFFISFTWKNSSNLAVREAIFVFALPKSFRKLSEKAILTSFDNWSSSWGVQHVDTLLQNRKLSPEIA